MEQQNDARKHMNERTRQSQVASLKEKIQKKKEFLAKVRLTPESYEVFSKEIEILERQLKTIEEPLT